MKRWCIKWQHRLGEADVMPSFGIKDLAIPSVVVLIIFLSYSSQYLFLYIEPSPLDKPELIKFNILVACIWICYARACFTDPGIVPAGWKSTNIQDQPDIPATDNLNFYDDILSTRWCRRCEVSKPPRAHHCKHCRRCIPKMDHHCPWTANCVSHLTFPHFIRFLFYAVAAMGYLEYFLFIRASIIWRDRDMASYYGPSALQLAHLFVLLITNSMVLFLLLILAVRAVWMMAQNQTTIEGWEIERHKTLVRRAKVFGGYLDGPDGMRVRIRKQEFPYDIGIWENIRDGMGGTNNVLAWFFPFSATPSIESGLEFEVNGFEDPSVPWPPPDPDRIPRKQPQYYAVQQQELRSAANTSATEEGSFTADSIAAFRQRQEADLLRRRHYKSTVNQTVGADSETARQKPFHERYGNLAGNKPGPQVESVKRDRSTASRPAKGEEAWRTSEGERLDDFGVDEDVEFYDYGTTGRDPQVGGEREEGYDEDEDDIPLAQLIERRKHGNGMVNT